MSSHEAVPALQVRGISKRFGGVQALDDVSFAVHPGEVVALVGDNGAGKSTLVKTIAGVLASDEGEIEVNGQPARINSPADANALGIEVIYQDLALCDNLDVVANIFLGREQQVAVQRSPLRPLDEIGMERQAVETLRSLDVNIASPRTRVSRLSGGQRQAIAIAKAVMWQSRIVLLDEPTAALGVAQTRQVLELIKRLRTKGLAVIVISHNMADVLEVADRVVVLRLGRRVADLRREGLTPEHLIGAITGASSQDAA